MMSLVQDRTKRQARIVCGSRTYRDYTMIESTLMAIWREATAGFRHEADIVVIHGDCEGADKSAGLAAYDIGFSVVPMPYISHLGGNGGPSRNRAMLDVLNALAKVGYEVGVIAFIDKPLTESRGTRNMVNIAERAGVPVTVYGPQ